MNAAALLDQLSQQGIELWFEGTRLRFRGPRGALTVEQRTELVALRDEVIAVLRERAAADVRRVPLSYGQRSLWFVSQDEPDSVAYNVAFVLHILSPIDRAALQDAFQALVDRHAILRTTYDVVDGEPCQRVAGTGVCVFHVQELPGLDDAACRARVEAEYKRPFDLRQGPLMRTTLFSRGAEDHVLLIIAHHIAVDGRAMMVLLEELRALYVESTAGTPAGLPRPTLQYSDFTEWQAQMLASEEGEKLARYWQAKLAAPRAEIEVPSDRPRPPRKSVHGATFGCELDADLVQRLGKLGRNEGTTLFVLLLAAFKILLYRYTGTEDVVVGTPTLGRSRPEFKRILGHFVNPVPLRSRLTAQTTVRELVASLRQTLIEALEGQDYPLALMVERLRSVRDPSRSPLFETMFVFQQFEQFRDVTNLLALAGDDTTSDFGGLQVRPYDLRQQEGQFDLTLQVTERTGPVWVQFKYNSDLFDERTIAGLAQHLRVLLEGMADDPTQAIGRLPLLTPADRAVLLGLDAHAVPAMAAAQTLHARFEAQVRRVPQAVAATCEGEHFTYAELNRRANHLAHRLRELGVGRDTVVGLCIERSLDVVIGVVAILKAGGAYLPIDLAYPADRVAFMLADAAAPVLLTERRLFDRVPSHQGTTVFVDDDLAAYPDSDPPHITEPDDLAYVIYTSGSTGKPKGTMLTHGAVDRLFTATDAWYRFDDRDVWTLFHSIAFDFSVWELWGALLYGGRLVVVPYMVSRSPDAFRELLEREGVTILNQTPSAFRQLIQTDAREAKPLARLRSVIFGGEALELQSLRPWFDRYGDRTPTLVNMYGITETCVHVTYRPISIADLDASAGSVIGVPIPDLRVYVLDQFKEPVPRNVPGEMYVGGPGLARGYLNRPDLTAERFIPDPFVEGGRLYRTGDLAKRLAGGELEYLGRIDHQVKIRGFRVELGEIEAVIARTAGVRETAVIVREDTPGDRRLVAYVVADGDETATLESVRRGLAAALPAYMVPAAFVFIAGLPLTNNGKVDRNALPAPNDAGTMADEDYHAPATDTEKVVADVFAEVLNVPVVSAHHSFFELGGHSLLATRVLARLRERFNIHIPLIALFEAPTAQGLGRWLDTALGKQSPVEFAEVDEAPQWSCLVPTRSTGSKPPLVLVTGYMDQDDTVRILSNLIPHLGPDQPLCGLRPRWLDGRSPNYSSVAEVTGEYVRELRAFQPQGPYYLVGDCVGGVLAFEMAQTLVEQGEEVALLALLDTERPRYYSLLLTELERLWQRGHHIASICRNVVWPHEGTRRQVIADVVQRKFRRSSLTSTPITTTDHIYEQRTAYQRLLKRHRVKRYPGNIKLIVTDDFSHFVRFLGWRGFADEVKIFRTRGDHRTFRAQYAKEFGECLLECIDQANSEREKQNKPVTDNERFDDGEDRRRSAPPTENDSSPARITT